MMNWLQERSKYEDYGDEGIPSSPEKWYEFLLLLLVMALLPYLFALIAILFALGATSFGFYFLAKHTRESGELKFPTVACLGVIVAFVITTLFVNDQINFGEHAALIGFSSIFVFVFTLGPLIGLVWRLFKPKLMVSLLNSIFILLVLTRCSSNSPAYPTLDRCLGLHTMSLPECAPPTSLPATKQISIDSSINILVDDFGPQPYQGNSIYYYNRLEGDRGALNNADLSWGVGQVRMAIAPGNSWAGMWMSLNHPIREDLPIKFSAILPGPILSKYQSQITGIQIQIAEATPGRVFKVELKYGDTLQWKEQISLNGNEEMINLKLPKLGNINRIVLVLDQGLANDYVVIERVSLTAKTHIKDTATTAFVWSYGMLLNNWNPETGLVRDKAKDGSGEFDAIQATGSLAAATAVAEQLGVIHRKDAIQIINRISETLLNEVPRYHGLLPHWVKILPNGGYVIVENTEWSSVDTVIAMLGLLEAQTSVGLDTSGTEQLLREIDWTDLITDKGISHGYTYDGNLIPYAWDVFGGESWLVQLAYASVKGQVAPLTYSSPPTANGSGFIDELVWSYVPPPAKLDHWGTDWNSYRSDSAESQIRYYPVHDPTSCFSQHGLFGLSAGEVPNPYMVSQSSIYQAYGVGGAFSSANDGSTLGTSVVVPHYSAMIASLHPQAAIQMWNWLIANGYFSPLTNAESLAFQDNVTCDSKAVYWNQLKGSWNLSLQTLGWGRYLAERENKIPVLWQAGMTNPFLQEGYDLLAPNGSQVQSTKP